MAGYLACCAGVVLIVTGIKVLNGPPIDFDMGSTMPQKFEQGKRHVRQPDSNTNYIGEGPHEFGEDELVHNYYPLQDRDGKVKNFINEGGVEGIAGDKGDLRAVRQSHLAGIATISHNPNIGIDHRTHVWHKTDTKTPFNNRNRVLPKVHQNKLFKRMSVKVWDI